MSIKTVYCDMDGVLVDFRAGAKALDAIEGTKVDWSKIHEAGAKFWAELEWTNDGKALWSWLTKVCNEHKIDLCILSAINFPEGEDGKRKWIKNNLGGVSEHNIYFEPRGVLKAKYADDDALLIDDFGKNINAFIAKGGKGILYTNFADCKNEFADYL